MKKLIAVTLTLLSLTALAADERCSPYVTETTSIIQQLRSCRAAISLARVCTTGSRRDVELAYQAVNTCRDLIGGEENLAAAPKRKMRAGYKRCSQAFPNDHVEAMFCMAEVLRTL